MPKVFVYFRNFKKLTNFFLSLVVFQKKLAGAKWRVFLDSTLICQLRLTSPKNCEVSWLFDSSSWELNIPTPGSLWSIAWQQRVLSWPFGFWFFSLIHSDRIFCVLLSFTLEEAKISDFLVWLHAGRFILYMFAIFSSFSLRFFFFFFQLLLLSLFNFCAFAATLCWFWEQSSKMSGPLNLGLLGKSKYLKNIFALRFLDKSPRFQPLWNNCRISAAIWYCTKILLWNCYQIWGC